MRERQQQKPSTKCQIEINVKNGLVCSAPGDTAVQGRINGFKRNDSFLFVYIIVTDAQLA